MLRIFVAGAIVAALGGAPAQAITTAPTVDYGFDGLHFNITSSGPTTLTLAPGEAFGVTGSWATSGLISWCPICVIQFYIAGGPSLPGQTNLYNTVVGNNTVSSGIYSLDLVAPETPGTYYIAGTTTLDFAFQSNRVGAPNGSDQVSYIINVGASDVETPEPASLAILAAGVLGLAVRRTFRSAA